MGPGFPGTVGEMIDSDVPQLSLKAVTFADATLLITFYPHISWDAFGYLGLQKMIQLVLDGREDEVPPMLGGKDDVLSEIARPYRDVKGEDPLLTRMNQAKEANQAQSEQTAPQIPPLDPRIMCIPTEIAGKLQQHLQEESSRDELDDYRSLRSDEVMSAWVVQQLAKVAPIPRPVALMNLVNIRLIIPPIAKAKGIYTQNMLLVASNTLSPEVATGPVGPIAHSQRACIAHMAEPQQAARFLATIIGAIEANFDTTAISSSNDATPILVNNLTNLTNDLDIDYSSALVSQGENATTRTNPLGTVDFGYIADVTNPYPYPKLTMVGSLTGDTCWMFGELPGEAWESIEEYLEELSFGV